MFKEDLGHGIDQKGLHKIKSTTNSFMLLNWQIVTSSLNLGKIVNILNQLFQKVKPYKWTAKYEESLEPKLFLSFVLATDASSTGTGTVLAHKHVLAITSNGVLGSSVMGLKGLYLLHHKC